MNRYNNDIDLKRLDTRDRLPIFFSLKDSLYKESAKEQIKDALSGKRTFLF